MKIKYQPKQIAIGAALLVAAALATFLAIELVNKSAGKNLVLAGLKDPESAIFGDYTKIGSAACLTVNAKNSMGGYVGAQQATLIKEDGNWSLASIEEISHAECTALIKEMNDAASGHSDLCKELKRSIALHGGDKQATERTKKAAEQFRCDI